MPASIIALDLDLDLDNRWKPADRRADGGTLFLDVEVEGPGRRPVIGASSARKAPY